MEGQGGDFDFREDQIGSGLDTTLCVLNVNFATCRKMRGKGGGHPCVSD
jgi:hypothetical protein